MTTHDGGVISGRLTDDEAIAQAGSTDQRAVWAKLCQLATPILEHYHQDLIWDWAFIRTVWDPEGFDFYYGVRPSGTSCARTLDDWTSLNRAMGHPQAWHITVEFRGGHFGDAYLHTIHVEPIN